MPIHEIAALATAACWAITALIAARPSSVLGPFAFGQLRQSATAVLLAVFVFATGRWQGVSWEQIIPLLLSGIIGIFIGDTLLFAGMNRLGPRRNSIVFALNAPITALLGWMFLAESLSWKAMLGVMVSFFGVALAIFFGRKPAQTHTLEIVKGPLWQGLAFALGGAVGQALGSIIARPVMAQGFDPFVASALRVGIAAICLTGLMVLPLPHVKAPKGALTWNIAGWTVFSGILAMGIGMTLLLFALSGGKTGIVATLSATSPVLILPLLWATTGERPSMPAWIGSLLAVAGMALLFA